MTVVKSHTTHLNMENSNHLAVDETDLVFAGGFLEYPVTVIDPSSKLTFDRTHPRRATAFSKYSSSQT